MKRKKTAVLGALAVVAVAAVGCSSSGSGNNSGGAAGSCLASSSTSGSTACNTCVQNACSAQINDLSSPCSGYISCVCPGGNYSATAAASSSCQAEAFRIRPVGLPSRPS